MDKSVKPYSKAYVLSTTCKHMRKSVDISIQKTLSRISEFDGNQQKSQEIFETLAILHNLKKQLDDFVMANKQEFIGE